MKISLATRATLEETRGAIEVFDFCETDRGAAREGDWMLVFRWREDGQGARMAGLRWLFVDQAIQSTNKRRDDEVIQLQKLADCPEPPFRLDADFKRAFLDVTREENWDEMVPDFHKPTRAIVERLVERLE